MKKIVFSMMLAGLLAACSTTSQPDANAGAGTGSSSSGMESGSTAMNPLKDPNNILSQRSVYFDFDSFVVKSDYRDMLSAHARYLSNDRNTHITIQGNTDNRGTAEYNLALGQKRADAVRRVLNLQGVPDAQIETVSFGKERPRSDANTEESWAQNRRADIVYPGD
jgi:peptidoglycan-associated lipoprotein